MQCALEVENRFNVVRLRGVWLCCCAYTFNFRQMPNKAEFRHKCWYMVGGLPVRMCLCIVCNRVYRTCYRFCETNRNETNIMQIQWTASCLLIECHTHTNKLTLIHTNSHNYCFSRIIASHEVINAEVRHMETYYFPQLAAHFHYIHSHEKKLRALQHVCGREKKPAHQQQEKGDAFQRENEKKTTKNTTNDQELY